MTRGHANQKSQRDGESAANVYPVITIADLDPIAYVIGAGDVERIRDGFPKLYPDFCR